MGLRYASLERPDEKNLAGRRTKRVRILNGGPRFLDPRARAARLADRLLQSLDDEVAPAEGHEDQETLRSWYNERREYWNDDPEPEGELQPAAELNSVAGTMFTSHRHRGVVMAEESDDEDEILNADFAGSLRRQGAVRIVRRPTVRLFRHLGRPNEGDGQGVGQNFGSRSNSSSIGNSPEESVHIGTVNFSEVDQTMDGQEGYVSATNQSRSSPIHGILRSSRSNSVANTETSLTNQTNINTYNNALSDNFMVSYVRSENDNEDALEDEEETDSEVQSVVEPENQDTAADAQVPVDELSTLNSTLSTYRATLQNTLRNSEVEPGSSTNQILRSRSNSRSNSRSHSRIHSPPPMSRISSPSPIVRHDLPGRRDSSGSESGSVGFPLERTWPSIRPDQVQLVSTRDTPQARDFSPWESNRQIETVLDSLETLLKQVIIHRGVDRYTSDLVMGRFSAFRRHRVPNIHDDEMHPRERILRQREMLCMLDEVFMFVTGVSVTNLQSEDELWQRPRLVRRETVPNLRSLLMETPDSHSLLPLELHAGTLAPARALQLTMENWLAEAATTTSLDTLSMPNYPYLVFSRLSRFVNRLIHQTIARSLGRPQSLVTDVNQLSSEDRARVRKEAREISMELSSDRFVSSGYSSSQEKEKLRQLVRHAKLIKQKGNKVEPENKKNRKRERDDEEYTPQKKRKVVFK